MPLRGHDLDGSSETLLVEDVDPPNQCSHSNLLIRWRQLDSSCTSIFSYSQDLVSAPSHLHCTPKRQPISPNTMHSAALLALLPFLLRAAAAPRPMPFMYVRDDMSDSQSQAVMQIDSAAPSSMTAGSTAGLDVQGTDAAPTLFVPLTASTTSGWMTTSAATFTYTSYASSASALSSSTAVSASAAVDIDNVSSSSSVSTRMVSSSASMRTSSAASRQDPATTSATSASASATSTSISMARSTSLTPSASSSSSSPSASAADLSAESIEQDQPSSSAAKSRKIRYKECQSTGTVTEITITPCQGGKGTIDDPCEFHAGSYVMPFLYVSNSGPGGGLSLIVVGNRNYTIDLTYVTPAASSSPRANLSARDRTMSGSGGEYYPYSGQSFVRRAKKTGIASVLMDTIRMPASTPTVPFQPTQRVSTRTSLSRSTR